MIVLLNQEQIATLLAALRYYQKNDQDDPGHRDDEINDIATDGGELLALERAGVEELCDILNSEEF